MAIIHIAGLGPGGIGSIPYGTVQLLEQNRLPVFLRTAQHPSVDLLVERQIPFHSLDDVYEQAENFDDLYRAIVDYLLSEADKHREILYLVPGHPAVAEKTVQLLRAAAEAKKVELRFGPGQSFMDEMLQRLEVEPVEGLLVLDAITLKTSSLQPRVHTVLMQVYNKAVASDVKMTLAEVYGDEWEVVAVRAIGIPGEEHVIRLPLYELDRAVAFDHLTSVYVPPLQTSSELYGEWSELVEIVATLRGPQGCPWDLEQTHASLRPYVIEEAYEVAQSIDEGNINELVEELGDLLLQVLLHSQVGRDEGFFEIRDVIRALSTKLIRRHPHVFGEGSAIDAREVVKNWEQIKKTEKQATQQSLLDRVKKGMSPLLEGYELQKAAAKVGFDWPDVMPVYAKLEEELEEFRQAKTTHEQIQEFGDVLFSLVNIGRHLGISPEHALTLTNQKFRQRFFHVEQEVNKMKMDISEVELAILEGFWQNAKEIANSQQEFADNKTNSDL